MGFSPGFIILGSLGPNYVLECVKAIAESPVRYVEWRHARSRWIARASGYGDLRKFG
jgi:hypothetical protein